jgi:hypothetical protein
MNARQIVIPGKLFIFHESLQDLKVVVHHVAYCWWKALTMNLFKLFVNTVRVLVAFRGILVVTCERLPNQVSHHLIDKIKLSLWSSKARICDTFLGL